LSKIVADLLKVVSQVPGVSLWRAIFKGSRANAADIEKAFRAFRTRFQYRRRPMVFHGVLERRCGDNSDDGRSIQTLPSEVNMKTRNSWQ
jgi:hypothetical protein